MIVCLNSFRRDFFLKIPSKSVAFISDLLYIAFCCPPPRCLGGPRIQRFQSILTNVFSKYQSSFFGKIEIFKGFLRVKSNFFGLLNTALPFQHRNKIGFLCVT